MATSEITGTWSLMIGRYSPLHKGHITLVRKILDEGGKVCFGIRNTLLSDRDPFTITKRIQMIVEEFGEEINKQRVSYVVLPDIKEIVFGRKVGWGIREIRLDKQTEEISATKIREQMKNRRKSA